MQTELTIKASINQMEYLFDNLNIRYYKPTEEDLQDLEIKNNDGILNFDIVIRHGTNYVPALKKMIDTCLKYAELTPKHKSEFVEGAILCNSWGWEQTNIEYYVILERKGDWVTIMQMKKDTSEETGFMSNDVTPTKINFELLPIRKKIKKYQGKESGFSFGNYSGAGWCRLWNGKAMNETHYA